MNRLMTLAEAADLIRSGAALSLAGPETALDALPAGNWIAGTIPYFMDTAGGVVSTEGKVFVTPLPASGKAMVKRLAATHSEAFVEQDRVAQQRTAQPAAGGSIDLF